MKDSTLTMLEITSLLKANKSDREIIALLKDQGHKIIAIEDMIQLCKIRLSRVKGQNPGPVDPNKDFDLRVWRNPNL